MNRQLTFSAIVAISGLAAFLSASPDGIRLAEGCAGKKNIVCSAPGWAGAAWAVDPTGVPTDGAVRVQLTGTYACDWEASPGAGPGAGGAGGGSGVTITVRGPGGEIVPGTPGSEGVPAVVVSQATGPAPAVKAITWRPKQYFLPSTTYTLRVEGLMSSPSAVDLSFTTGAGSFALPKPLLLSPSVKVDSHHELEPSVCCTVQGAGGCATSVTTCAGITVAPRPVIEATADVDEPLPAAKIFWEPMLLVSKDGGGYVSSKTADLTGAKETVCAKVQVVNTLTYQSVTGDPWCTPVTGLDLASSPNCVRMLAQLTKCASPPSGGTAKLSESAELLYELRCGAAGAGGAAGGSAAGGGASGGGASGGSASGGGASGGGASGGAAGGSASGGGASGGGASAAGGSSGDASGGGAAGVAAAAPAADDGGGCSVASGPRSAAAGGALGALLGLAALLRARRGARPDDRA